MNKSGLTLTLTVLLALTAMPALAQQFGGALAIGHDMIVVGESSNLTEAGTLYFFHKTADGWTEAATLKASEAGEDPDHFGRALSIDGSRLLVGATTVGGTLGAAYILEHGANGWAETAVLRPSDLAEGHHFGRAVALHGDYALVAAAGANEDRGAVYVFHRGTTGVWMEHTKLTPEDTQAGDLFGLALAFDGTTALIGAPHQNENTGAVYAYRHDANTNTWTQTGKIVSEMVGEGDRFGAALAMAGPLAVIGAPNYLERTGGAFVFVGGGATGEYQQMARMLPFEGSAQAQFGTAIGINGDGQIWVSAPGSMGFEGAVYVLDRSKGDNHITLTRLAGTSNGGGDFVGGALAVNGDLAVVGALGDDYGIGTALVFERQDGQWVEADMLAGKNKGMASVTGGQVDCAEGSANMFGCSRIDLLSFLSVEDIGGGRGIRTNDIWGWVDPATNNEYALVGRIDGTAFVDVSDPMNPVYLGDLPRTEGSPVSVWRDIKVYKNHAYIVADNAGEHGVQVFDLTQLRTVENAPVTFAETARYNGINSAHNIVINEDTGFAYAVGNSRGGETCGGGLHMINLQEPARPTFAGCFADPSTGRASTGYSHDAQCILYHGPDEAYQGHEICFGANETALSIADVTDKDKPVPVSTATYPNVGYTHQGWITDDHRYFYVNDELDEIQGKVDRTRTLIWDVTDLDDPQLVKEHFGETGASDHNLYIRGNLMYQSNYVSGLRILDITDPANPVEVGYFDTVPAGDNSAGFGGSWSNYPFFPSGIIVVTSGQEGLFVLKKQDIDI